MRQKPKVHVQGDCGTRAGEDPRAGVILFIVLGLIAVLSIVGSIVFAVTSHSIQMTSNYKRGTDAFYQADAGAEYVFSRIKKDFDDGTLDMKDPMIPVNYAAPSGFSFDPVTTLYQLGGEKAYKYRVVGHAGKASAAVDVVIGWHQKFNMGFFGDDNLSMAPGTKLYSYDSDQTLHPTPVTSTGQASAGTNGELNAGGDAIDGLVVLGEDTNGDGASYAHETSSSSDVVRADQIENDPLGAIGGALADEFSRVAALNDNGQALGGSISGSTLTIRGDVTLTAGEYYVDEIDINNHRTLTVDASLGPVSIYLTGPLFIASNGDLTLNPPKPGNLIIYSNSTQPVEMKPKTSFYGVIYAPYAPVTVMPNGDLYGAIWGDTLEIKPNGACFMDKDVARDLSPRYLKKLWWKVAR